MRIFAVKLRAEALMRKTSRKLSLSHPQLASFAPRADNVNYVQTLTRKMTQQPLSAIAATTTTTSKIQRVVVFLTRPRLCLFDPNKTGGNYAY